MKHSTGLEERFRPSQVSVEDWNLEIFVPAHCLQRVDNVGSISPRFEKKRETWVRNLQFFFLKDGVYSDEECRLDQSFGDVAPKQSVELVVPNWPRDYHGFYFGFMRMLIFLHVESLMFL